MPHRGKYPRQGQWHLGVSWHQSSRVGDIRKFENILNRRGEEVLENFHVTREQVQSVLDFAAKAPVAKIITAIGAVMPCSYVELEIPE